MLLCIKIVKNKHKHELYSKWFALNSASPSALHCLTCIHSLDNHILVRKIFSTSKYLQLFFLLDTLFLRIGDEDEERTRLIFIIL